MPFLNKILNNKKKEVMDLLIVIISIETIYAYKI